MPVSFKIDTELSVVRCRSWGAITDNELAAYARALRRDARFQPTFSQLVDLRGVESFHLTIDGVRELATLNPFAPTARRAVLVSTDCGFGMVRMYQSCLANAENLLICRTAREAFSWLGIETGTAWPADSADWISNGAPAGA
ncbi:MAG: hypothetical protein AB1762_11115 [Gemmatimonadota bacterium]